MKNQFRLFFVVPLVLITYLVIKSGVKLFFEPLFSKGTLIIGRMEIVFDINNYPVTYGILFFHVLIVMFLIFLILLFGISFLRKNDVTKAV